MTGIELIAKERQEQIEKHDRPTEYDVMYNANKELYHLAMATLLGTKNLLPERHPGWDVIVDNMVSKQYKERLIIAGALIAAEIDRIQYNEATPLKTTT